MTLFNIGLFAWYIIGVIGYILFVIQVEDFTTQSIFPAPMAAVLGPFCLFAWYMSMPASSKNQTVIFRKRKK